MQDDLYQYTGNELELFSAAKKWKKYVARFIAPYINGAVLEAGAGIGTNTLIFFNHNVSSWTLLEPDQKNHDTLQTLLSGNHLPPCCSIINGYTKDIAGKERFDTIIYIDVIEHIEDDKKEILTATNLLKKNGHLVVLSPAHMFLMSPFDNAIGHYRRYSKKTMLSVAGERLEVVKTIYIDSIGLFASLANKYILKQQYPGKKQIALWNNWMIPLSKMVDRLFFTGQEKQLLQYGKKTNPNF